MDQAGTDASQHPRPKGERQGQIRIHPSRNQGRRDSCSQWKTSVHRQIREIQYLVCDIYSQRQYPINQTLFRNRYYKIHENASQILSLLSNNIVKTFNRAGCKTFRNGNAQIFRNLCIYVESWLCDQFKVHFGCLLFAL